MFYDILTACGGIMALGLFWLGVQYLVRRQTPDLPPDCDVLEHLSHGCRGCKRAGTCDMRNPRS